MHESLIREKCYSGIDTLPIWNWNKIFETKDLKYLLLVSKIVTEKESIILNTIYEEFYDAYLEEFGLNEKEQEIREKRQSYILNMALVLKGDKGAQTFVDIDKMDLDELTKPNEYNQSIWELKSKMEVSLKINIDVKKCSIIEFYSYLKIISEMNNKPE